MSARRPGADTSWLPKPPAILQTVSTLTEEKLAQRFESRYQGRLHYDHHRGRWFVWDEARGCWVRNEKRLAFHFAREVCRSCNEQEKKEFARASTYAGVERICQCSPDFAVTAEHWDRDIWLLGVPGGTVDLRSGEMYAPRQEDYITKQTAVAPDWRMPRPVFDRFLNEITQGDQELQRYLQRIVGYSLTGSTREEKLFFIFGPGGNGKSKFVNAMALIAGDYAVTATMEAFIEKRGERHTTDVAALAGARIAIASETQKGRRWDEALIGRLTGGDPITARFMRRDNFSFNPQFTLLIVGNHAPELSTVNDANRRRFQIIPFNFSPVKPDDRLADKLRPEWPAILAWMIDGAREWCSEGLGMRPEVVSEETEEYFDEQDPVKTWLDECCELGRNLQDTSEHLFASFEAWCKKNGEHPGKKTGLIRILKRQYGCKKDREEFARGLAGIAVRTEYRTDPRTGEREES
jgi:putative DNA primase/helicase